MGTGREAIRLAEVRLQESESLENALRRFKRKVQQEDIIKGGQASLLLHEAGREEAREESLSAKASSKKSPKESD
jgi:small subunit ribosomal protein S21